VTKVAELTVPPRQAKAFEVPAGHFFRIVSVEGPQVGDLNLWNAHDLKERFYSGKTRALHATHLSTGDRLWSSFPRLRPMATITHDTLDWYGWDEDGPAVHDVIGTRCDPYTNLLKGDGTPVLLSLEFDAGPRGGAEAAARRSRGSCSRRDERIHVHWLYTRHTSVLYESKSRSPRRFHRIFLPRWICWLRSLLVPAATAALFTPTTRPSAFHSWSRSIGRTRERWPAGNHRRRTDILARMEPGKGRL
jgi:hypothetical protein